MSNTAAKRGRPAKEKATDFKVKSTKVEGGTIIEISRSFGVFQPPLEDTYPKWFIITSEWHSHRPALLFALQITQGDVMELGMGEGSTQLLHDYALRNRRKTISLETKEEWAAKYLHLNGELHSLRYIDTDSLSFGDLKGKIAGLVFIDIAPGERRAKDLRDLANLTDLVAIHDSQPSAPYGLDFSMYKFKLDYPHPAAWTTLCSNTIDLSQYHGLELGGVKFHSWNEPSDRLPN